MGRIVERSIRIVFGLASVVVLIALVLPCASLAWIMPAPAMVHGCHGYPTPHKSHACCYPKLPLPVSAHAVLPSVPAADSVPDLVVADWQQTQAVTLESSPELAGSPPDNSAVLRI